MDALLMHSDPESLPKSARKEMEEKEGTAYSRERFGNASPSNDEPTGSDEIKTMYSFNEIESYRSPNQTPYGDLRMLAEILANQTPKRRHIIHPMQAGQVDVAPQTRGSSRAHMNTTPHTMRARQILATPKPEKRISRFTRRGSPIEVLRALSTNLMTSARQHGPPIAHFQNDLYARAGEYRETANTDQNGISVLDTGLALSDSPEILGNAPSLSIQRSRLLSRIEKLHDLGTSIGREQMHFQNGGSTHLEGENVEDAAPEPEYLEALQTPPQELTQRYENYPALSSHEYDPTFSTTRAAKIIPTVPPSASDYSPKFPGINTIPLSKVDGYVAPQHNFHYLEQTTAKRPEAHPKIPKTLLKSLFHKASSLSVSLDAVLTVHSLSTEFFAQVSEDLLVYASHAKRNNLLESDVLQLLQR